MSEDSLLKIAIAVSSGFLALALASATQAQDASPDWGKGPIRHVLLISIDGFHAVDYLNCSAGLSWFNNGAPYCPALAALGQTGVNYLNTSTSKPSDSFPGLMALVTGGSPRTVGAFYDVAYDRTFDPPAVTTGNGVAAGTCTAGQPGSGSTTEFDEGIDIDKTKLNGGAPGASLTDGGIASIDSSRLDRDPKNNCAPIYPWDFVRTNTIFGVIHAAGGYTAWSDKHPSYSAVAGNSNGSSSLDDYFAPEINSAVVALPGITTPTGLSCSPIPDSSQFALGSWTNSFQDIQCYDTIKVDAILNEIDGKNHDGQAAKVPTILGMNFQAVSVGQKLIEQNVGTGGYMDAAGTPTDELLSEIKFVDASIGAMVAELKKQGLYSSTLIVITAKHGQSPIDPTRYLPVPGPNGNNGIDPATVIESYLPYSESPANSNGIGPTEDDVALLWLQDSSDLETAVSLIQANVAKEGIGQIYYGPTVAQLFNPPGVPPTGDPRTPDIVITPNVGVTYTGSSTKLAEHGGFSHDDTNVILLVSNPSFPSLTLYSAVETLQVAPTILKALGLDPRSLDAVRLEGTQVLPGLKF
jgi:hypothetical protein